MNVSGVSIHAPVLGLEPTHAADVWEMLVEADHAFVPPLSARSSSTQSVLDASTVGSAVGPQAYFHALQDQYLILARSSDPDPGVAGFMSFRRDYALPVGNPQTRYQHVTTVLVRPQFRGLGLTRSMYDTLFADARATLRGVSTRTWSTNTAHITLLERLGFHTVQRIINDRGEGIDTVYFAKDAQDDHQITAAPVPDKPPRT